MIRPLLLSLLLAISSLGPSAYGFSNLGSENDEVANSEYDFQAKDTDSISTRRNHIKGHEQAVSVIYPSRGGMRLGVLTLDQYGMEVTIKGSVMNLPKNAELGFHVHQSGDTSNETHPCDSTGPHFNPTHKTHGAPTDSERHVGDLGNIKTDSSGEAMIQIKDSVISIKLGSANSIIGRAFVIHQGRDDLGRGGAPTSKTNGNSGTRIACGVIGTICCPK